MARNVLASETEPPEAAIDRKSGDRRQIRLMFELNSGLNRELIEQSYKEAKAHYMACYDGLTGLINRDLLRDRFQEAILLKKRQQKLVALLLFQLDEFKNVHERLGQTAGDKLLQAVAQRITKSVRGTDTVCRYGSAEFVILLPAIDNADIATALALEIGGHLSEPYNIGGYTLHLAISAGVSTYPDSGHNFEALLQQVNVAMYRIKGAGHNTSIAEQIQESPEPVQPQQSGDTHGIVNRRSPILNIEGVCTHTTGKPG